MFIVGAGGSSPDRWLLGLVVKSGTWRVEHNHETLLAEVIVDVDDDSLPKYVAIGVLGDSMKDVPWTNLRVTYKASGEPYSNVRWVYTDHLSDALGNPDANTLWLDWECQSFGLALAPPPPGHGYPCAVVLHSDAYNCTAIDAPCALPQLFVSQCPSGVASEEAPYVMDRAPDTPVFLGTTTTAEHNVLFVLWTAPAPGLCTHSIGATSTTLTLHPGVCVIRYRRLDGHVSVTINRDEVVFEAKVESAVPTLPPIHCVDWSRGAVMHVLNDVPYSADRHMGYLHGVQPFDDATDAAVVARSNPWYNDDCVSPPLMIPNTVRRGAVVLQEYNQATGIATIIAPYAVSWGPDTKLAIQALGGVMVPVNLSELRLRRTLDVYVPVEDDACDAVVLWLQPKDKLLANVCIYALHFSRPWRVDELPYGSRARSGLPTTCGHYAAW